MRDQWEPVADYAAWLVDDGVERDIAMLRLTGLLRGLWVTDADESNWARGFSGAVVLADQYARGDLPGFEDWAAGSGSDDDGLAAALMNYADHDLGKDRPENEQPFHDYLARSDAMLEVVR